MNDEFYELVDRAVDAVFIQDMYLLRAYPYFKNMNATKKQVREFIESDTAKNPLLVTLPLLALICSLILRVVTKFSVKHMDTSANQKRGRYTSISRKSYWMR